MPGCRVAGVPGGVYNRTICRSLSRTREVRRSANQIGIPPLVHCHKMAALNQPDSAYCAPPPGAPLAARHEKLRLSIHFYRSCFAVSPSRSSTRLRRLAFLPESRARSSFFYLPPPSPSRFLTLPPLFNNRSLFHRAPYAELPCPFACLLVTDLVRFFSDVRPFLYRLPSSPPPFRPANCRLIAFHLFDNVSNKE